MAVNLEPYAGEMETGGIRLENNLIVRDEGPDIYTTYPFDERFLDDAHPLDRTTGRMIRR
jgi:Xaa-Pro aminopeptidase